MQAARLPGRVDMQERTLVNMEPVTDPPADVVPVLPLRDVVIFPHMVMPLIVGRPHSLRALHEAKLRNRDVLLLAQRSGEVDEPELSDLYSVGTLGRALQVWELPDGSMRVLVEGLRRARVLEAIRPDPYLEVRVEPVEEDEDEGVEVRAAMRAVLAQFEQVVGLSRTIPPEALVTAMNVDQPGKLADLVAGFANAPTQVKQELLETASASERLRRLGVLLTQELEILELEKKIHTRVREELQSSQKEMYLREQMRAIQDELGEREGTSLEAEEYRKKIAECGMTGEASEKALKEVERLERMPPMVPEGYVIRTYLDWLVSLPWAKATEDKLDVDEAARILDEDHYGLDKVKERVLEFLAVRQLTSQIKGPILCFMGPPGVGKTSIGRSIARAMGREFIRVSLGGVRDEAEIRGHRRTYVGALPGRIIQAIRHVGSRNPVFMMDEIDKLGVDFRGDPSAALLEALDPEQNTSFSDHYLEVPFDLSQVMFITTGNFLDRVPPALQDRMEVIEFPGYIEEEKVKIAELFLVPKQLQGHGLTKDNVRVSENALRKLVRNYTREAGVRNLERDIASICRKVARQVASGQAAQIHVTMQNLPKFLGPERYRYGRAEERDEVGVATGLSYTQVGGDVLPIEVSLVEGKGDLLLTGQLGDVMKESGQAALSYARSRAKQLGVLEGFFEKTDIHIHCPSGAIPKDGPSAGVAMATALASALSNRPVRKDVALTGEVTLRGKVLPIGGVKEKVLAAHRAGITTVVLPSENEKDIQDVPQHVRRELSIKYVDHMDQVLEEALAASG
jgi:ATP-dependent Lon protease